MAVIKLVSSEQVNKPLESIELHKGDIVKLESGSFGLVVSNKGDGYLVTSLSGSVGNYCGDSFESHTTVKRYNRTHYNEIVAVYPLGSYNLKLEV